MYSRIKNIKAIAKWGYINELYSSDLTCGIHVDCRIEKGLVHVNFSTTAIRKIVSEKGLIEFIDQKKFLLNNCFCSICNTKVINLQICTCVNNLKDHEPIPNHPFYVQANKRDLNLLEGFFTVLRKRSREYEHSTKIYAKERQDIIKRSRYSINKEDIGKIFDIQSGECYYCGTPFEDDFGVKNRFHVDHLIPLSLGGQHSPLNLVIACIECNLKKCKKTEEEFFKVLSRTRNKVWLEKRQENVSKIKIEIALKFPDLDDKAS